MIVIKVAVFLAHAVVKEIIKYVVQDVLVLTVKMYHCTYDNEETMDRNCSDVNVEMPGLDDFLDFFCYSQRGGFNV